MAINVNEILKDAAASDSFLQNQIKLSVDKKEIKFWTGKVIKNDDPSKAGRVKIRVFGAYDDLAEAAIPWAHPEFSYIGSKVGSFIVPEVGTEVRGYFEDGDPQKPTYTGLAFNADAKKNATSKTARTTDYPDTMILFETDKGDFLSANRKDGTIKFNHRSGLLIEIMDNGAIYVSNTGTSDDTASCTFDIQGDVMINSQSNVDVICEGNARVSSKGTVSITSGSQTKMLDGVGLGIDIEENNMPSTPCNNLTNCLITGIQHYTQKNVVVPLVVPDSYEEVKTAIDPEE